MTATDGDRFTLRVVPLGGPIIHGHAPHAHDIGSYDYVAAGIAALGPLSYSLLRAEALQMHRRRAANVRVLLDRLNDEAKRIEKIRRVDAGQADKIGRQHLKLYLWDLIKEVGEACEQLAAFYSAARAWDANGTDVALTLLRWDKTSHVIFNTPQFQDHAWWIRMLGLTANETRLAAITPREREIVLWHLETASRRLPVALAELKDMYGRDLHRVAVRRRHLAPLLDSEHGIVFAGNDPATAEWVGAAVEDGALVLADHATRPGQVSQIVVPTTNGAVSDLVSLWSHANWLSAAIAGSVVARGENPAGVVVTSDFDAEPAFEGGVREAIERYVGLPEDLVAAHRSIESATREVVRAAGAERGVTVSRAERRQAARDFKKKRRR
ncbi:MAG: hypothetical protein A2W26_10805 [Acidobacteria bacterium RBG_16_64_8]|nr:MAG: hypothetical protein A2W26_10805 [Acidobacteria bacterium RBG_16_64_8]